MSLKHGAMAGEQIAFHNEQEDVQGANEVTTDDRPAIPPDGEQEFTDDDGTHYKWDCGIRAWVPQVYLLN